MSLGHTGNYEILEKLGAGGMGVVFKARDLRLDRVVALKLITDEFAADPQYRKRLMREARAEASLSHPNIATCFEIGEAEIEPPGLLNPQHPHPPGSKVSFLALEYVPGDDLLERIQRDPPSLSVALDLAIQIAAGLEAAHRAGVIHRDLKPGNVRVTPEGLAKILDFGLAHVLQRPGAAPGMAATTKITSDDRIVGTTGYMAPELMRGQPADERSDLFSFGVLVYQLVTGHLPFGDGPPLEILYSMANAEPAPLARYARDVPEELERIVSKLLAKQPDERYQSAHEVLTDLRTLRERAPARIAPRFPLVRGRRPRIAVFGAASVLAIIAVAWWVMGNHGSGPRNVAVLEFANESGDTTLDYVAAGLSDDILSGLVQQTDLNVVSHAAVAAARPAGKTLSAVSRELGVGAVLTGRLRRLAEGVHLDVELVQAANGYVRWSADYAFSIGAVLRIKQEIVRQVARALSARVSLDANSRQGGMPTPSVEAYDLYLHGMRQMEEPDDPTAPERAADELGRALALDPGFALAWAGRSRALARLYARDRSAQTLRSAEEAADRALELQTGLLEARIARVQVLRVTGRTDEAIAELQQVIKDKPNWEEAYLQLAATYRDAGQLGAAERSYRKAAELRPDYWRTWNSLGALLIRGGNYAGAREAFQNVVRLVPDRNRGYEQLAVLDMFEGRYEEAIEEYRRLPTPVEDATLASNIGTAYFYANRLDGAEEYYGLAVRLEPNSPIWRLNLGDLQTRQGRLEDAEASYRLAIGLTERALQTNPANHDLQAHLALCLAKVGDCEGSERALARIPAEVMSVAAEYQFTAAKAHSLCGRRARALTAAKAAIALGIDTRRLQQEDEFRALRDDPEFQKLSGSSGARVARP